LAAELKWCNEAWKEKSRAAKERRQRMGGASHRQGSCSHARWKKKMVREVAHVLTAIKTSMLWLFFTKTQESCILSLRSCLLRKHVILFLEQEKVKKRPVSDVEAYTVGRMGDQEGTFCNPKAAANIIRFYTSIFMSCYIFATHLLKAFCSSN
jgi:hypothetical protein